MKRIYTSLLFPLLFLALVLTIGAKKTFAASCSDLALSRSTIEAGQPFSVVYKGPTPVTNITVRAEVLGTNKSEFFSCSENFTSACSSNASSVSIINFESNGMTQGQTYTVNMFLNDGSSSVNDCAFSLGVTGNNQNFCSPEGVSSISPPEGSERSRFTFTGCMGATKCDNSARILLTPEDSNGRSIEVPIGNGSPEVICKNDGTFEVSTQNLSIGNYTAQLFVGFGAVGGQTSFTVYDDSQSGVGDACEAYQTCQAGVGFSGQQLCVGLYKREGEALTCNMTSCGPCIICGDKICTPYERTIGPLECQLDCVTKNFDIPTCMGNQGIQTAVGCIPFTSTTALVSVLLAWGLGIGGGLAFAILLLAGFKFMTSSGNPEAINSAKELTTSAVAGLVMLIFAIFVLRFVGVNILGLF